MGAGHDPYQGALSRPVLTHEGVDLARPQVEAHVLQGAHTREGLAHAGQAQESAHASGILPQSAGPVSWVDGWDAIIRPYGGRKLRRRGGPQHIGEKEAQPGERRISASYFNPEP